MQLETEARAIEAFHRRPRVSNQVLLNTIQKPAKTAALFFPNKSKRKPIKANASQAKSEPKAILPISPFSCKAQRPT